MNGSRQSIDLMDRFSEALSAANAAQSSLAGIGTYMERSQHRILKFYLESDASYHEVHIHPYIADICKDDHIYEIQTSGFSNLTSKLEVFLKNHSVTVVYPAAVKKTLVWSDPLTGEVIRGKTQTRKRAFFKLLPELFYVYKFFDKEDFSIDIIETEVEDIRLLDGRGKDRKIKATKVDLTPTGIVSTVRLSSIRDVLYFTGLEKDIKYYTEDLKKHFGLQGRKLSLAIKTLMLMNIIELKAKENKKNVYMVTDLTVDNNEKKKQ